MAHLENFRLTVFQAVAELRSFRKAADALLLTQSAVSQQIKALEEEVGTSVFDRSGSHVQLTAAGLALFKHAQHSRTILHKAEQEIALLHESQAGELCIGASTTIAQYLLPRLLAEYLRSHPRVQPKVCSGNTEQIVEKVRTQQAHLGLVEGPARCMETRSEPFLEDELLLVVPKGHEWAEAGTITVKELQGTPLLLRERGSGTRDVIEQALEMHKVRLSSLKIAMELDSSEAIKSAVEAGLGIGILSQWAIARDTRLGKNLQVVQLKEVRFRRTFSVIEKKNCQLDNAALGFKNFILTRSTAQQITMKGER